MIQSRFSGRRFVARVLAALAFVGCVENELRAQELRVLPGTQPLLTQGDLSAQMVAGIDTFLMRALERAPEARAAEEPAPGRA